MVLDHDGAIAGTAVTPTGLDFAEAGTAAWANACTAAGVEPARVVRVVSTGYGRRNAPFAHEHRTELTCHARGAHSAIPEAMTLVDIGGQDAKVIWVDGQGRQTRFRMNRTCAAGTGAFLEEIARRIGIALDDLEPLARRGTKDLELGSYCTVFASTEILALVRRGELIPDIVRAAFRSVARRVTDMAPLAGTVVATGGVVSHNPMVAEMIAAAAGCEVRVPPNAQLIGAIGAALIARDSGTAREMS